MYRSWLTWANRPRRGRKAIPLPLRSFYSTLLLLHLSSSCRTGSLILVQPLRLLPLPVDMLEDTWNCTGWTRSNGPVRHAPGSRNSKYRRCPLSPMHVYRTAGRPLVDLFPGDLRDRLIPFLPESLPGKPELTGIRLAGWSESSQRRISGFAIDAFEFHGSTLLLCFSVVKQISFFPVHFSAPRGLGRQNAPLW